MLLPPPDVLRPLELTDLRAGVFQARVQKPPLDGNIGSVGEGEGEEGLGIEAGAGEADGEVEVGAGGAARRPDAPDPLPATDRRSLGHLNRLEVEVERKKPEAMVEGHESAGEELLVH